MEKVLALLSNGLIGNTLGVVGVVLAVWFYLKARQLPELSAYVRTEQLIGAAATQKAGRLDVEFDGRSVKSLARTELTLWNSGNVPFRKSDIVITDPPAILMGANSQILEIFKLRESGLATSCEAEISVSPNKLKFSWEYLNPGDGCAWAVVYEGDANEKCSSSGAIVGLPLGIQLRGTKPRSKRTGLELIGVLVLASLAFLSIVEILLDFPYAR